MNKIIISRTDNLGDVILTLPMAGMLKSPESMIYFIGKPYTKPVIEACRFVDVFLDREQIIENPAILQNIEADVILFVFPDKQMARAAQKAGIPVRVGTGHRIFHWLYCNKLVNFSRKNSDQHESLLNFKLLEPLGIDHTPTLTEIPSLYGLQPPEEKLPDEITSLLQPEKINLIFHPKSKGSAREWPMENYYQLANALNPDKYGIFITGTAAEGTLIEQQQAQLFALPHVHNLTGKLTLGQLIRFISEADGLVACSTGPLHIAAALGKHTLGIYPPMRPIHPGRWAPVGKQAEVLVLNKNCDDCRKTQNCTCIQAITVHQVLKRIEKWRKESDKIS